MFTLIKNLFKKSEPVKVELSRAPFKKDAVTILTIARNKLASSWRRGELGYYGGQVCALGALDYADKKIALGGDEPHGLAGTPHRDGNGMDDAIRCLTTAINLERPGLVAWEQDLSPRPIWRYNDATDKSSVVNLFDVAIKTAKRRAA